MTPSDGVIVPSSSSSSALIISNNIDVIICSSFFFVLAAYGNLAAILARQERHVEAEFAYKQALAHRPNMAEVHFNL